MLRTLFAMVAIAFVGRGAQAQITQFCFPGTGSTIPCPCGQPPNPAGGCANFGISFTSGAVLQASGNASVLNDSIVFLTTNHRTAPPGGILNAFWTASGTTVPFGIKAGAGVKCADVMQRRLYLKTTNSFGPMPGSVSAPQPGDLSVTARCNQLLINISPGQTRHYFNVYRDALAAGPCNNTNDVVNTTNAVSITWGP